MTQATGHLRQVKGLLERHGLNTETQTAENIAFLLLLMSRSITPDYGALENVNDWLTEQHGQLQAAYPNLRIPSPAITVLWKVSLLRQVYDTLRQAKDASPYQGDLGQFFQREMRFELLKSATGSQYPTPHHIADLMAVLVMPDGQTTPLVADPTAGTGGLLAAVSGCAPQATFVGRDFDPTWAALGSANLLLHGYGSARYKIGSALDLHGETDLVGQCDTVVMNPPFGGVRSAREVEGTVGLEYGRSNPTPLVALAVRLLKPHGRAAILVPSSVFFRSRAEARLRALLAQQFLEAVITLPKDAFQPYNQIPTHLLMLEKVGACGARPTNAVWFCNAGVDGYGPGAGRDLAEEPDATINDLPRLRELILAIRRGGISAFPVGDSGVIRYAPLRPQDGLSAAAVWWNSPLDSSVVQASHLSEGVLVRITNEPTKTSAILYVPYSDGDAICASAHQPITWRGIVPAQSWADGLPSAWDTKAEEVTAALDRSAGRLTLLESGAAYWGLRPGSEGDTIACLIGEEGDVLSPWLVPDGKACVDAIVREDFLSDCETTAIRDVRGERCGCVVALTSQGESSSAMTRTVYLLIFRAQEAELLRSDHGSGWVAALLDQGWLRVGQSTPGHVLIEMGDAVGFRQGVPIQGIAVGPSPRGVSEKAYSLLGVLGPRSQFESTKDGQVYEVGSLEPSRFLPEPPLPPAAHPADIIAQIRKDQTRFAAKIDSLLDKLGSSPVSASDPEDEHDIAPLLVGNLDDQQRKLLGLLSQIPSGSFDLPEIVAHCHQHDMDCSQDYAYQQLTLFVKMGLLVQVHTQTRGQLYRPVRSGDIDLPDGRET